MTAAELRAALEELGWSQTDAARELGVSSRYRVSDWCRGVRPVPTYVGAAVRTHLELAAERAKSGGTSTPPTPDEDA
jgi:transcriptional regulator with XRE-family HTH domain